MSTRDWPQSNWIEIGRKVKGWKHKAHPQTCAHGGEQLDLNSSEPDGEGKAVAVPLHKPCSPHPGAATHLPARCVPRLSPSVPPGSAKSLLKLSVSGHLLQLGQHRLDVGLLIQPHLGRMVPEWVGALGGHWHSSTSIIPVLTANSAL